MRSRIHLTGFVIFFCQPLFFEPLVFFIHPFSRCWIILNPIKKLWKQKGKTGYASSICQKSGSGVPLPRLRVSWDGTTVSWPVGESSFPTRTFLSRLFFYWGKDGKKKMPPFATSFWLGRSLRWHFWGGNIQFLTPKFFKHFFWMPLTKNRVGIPLTGWEFFLNRVGIPLTKPPETW